ncbi:MAG TPA: DUF5689 domain-containing protein [Chitinophagaceae bacterium]|nr:DUF5689 domain-containing protein [Chitinophagaceae bacterium]
MKKVNVWLSGLAIILTASLVLFSCKKTFDEPQGPTDPGLTPTHTIRQLKAMHTTSGAYDIINSDIIISGVVVANDKSGNLYKEIYIQDGTAGINLLLDANGLYNSFPVGRKVYVKCNGLCISDYNRLVQLGVKATVAGTPSIEAIASNLIDKYVIGGTLNNTVTPKVVTVSQLTTSMQDSLLGTLIQLNNYEFVPGDTSKTFADTSAYKNSVNLTVRNCQANSSIIIRSSGYANFAGVSAPNGNGTLTAIYTLFGTTKQLIIRDTADVQFNNVRCGQGPTTVMNISDVRALFTGSTTSAPDGKRITGVVISDRSTNNLNSQNLVLQQGNNLSGILVRFDSPHAFNLGDSLDVNISQQEISEFNSLLQVNNVPLTYATRISTGKTITPRAVTLAQVNANFDAWESTLIKTGPVSLSGGSGGTYSGSVTLNDGATLVMFTSSGATFSGQTYPSNALSVTGYLTEFGSTKELSIRNPSGALNDVVPASGGGGGLPLTTSPYTQNFNNIAAGLPTGIFAKIGSSSSSIGTGDMPEYGSGLSSMTAWNQTSAGLKNFASATGLTATSDATAQNASSNRALGMRQTSSTGYDPGAAFVFLLDNTTGKTNFQLSFLLQSLDNSIGRTTTWTVEYGFGDSPASFTNITTSPATLTTGPTFASTPVTVNFGSALNNQSQKVWIRIVALSGTTGSGSRASTAIDDVSLSWN